MGVDYQTAVKVSAGFAGGMGLGGVCGAVSGGIMAIGLKTGGVNSQSGVQTMKVVRVFADRFKAQHRSLSCSDLTGFDVSKVDLNDPAALGEAYKAALARKAFAPCPGIVADATKIAVELVIDAPK